MHENLDSIHIIAIVEKKKKKHNEIKVVRISIIIKNVHQLKINKNETRGVSLLNTIFFFFDFISMVSHANIGAVPTFVVLKFCTYIVNLDHKSYRAS